ncbi:unnamed protein product [Rodentolepis nana]|uniref:MARVEL domain-containing protein n=1 Tax=Rodentolepis nana TaxID=102285 RepID=A0A0R3TPH0_RODNA|nr:unnamed protein product [Rodentolepis nana]
MYKKVGFGLLAALVLLMLILSLGIPSWSCQGHILGTECIRFYVLKVVGFLLAAATVAALLVAIFLLLVFLQGSSRMKIAALVTAGITALLAMAAVFYYVQPTHFWCPIVTAFGAGIALCLFAALLLDYLN